MLKAGFAIRDITPQRPYPMAGFDLRKASAEGVHDPLSVRTLVLDDGGERAVICVIDTLGVPDYMAAEIRKEICARLPVSDNAVQVSAIHTHAAPQSIFRSFSCYDGAYFDFIVQTAAEAAAAAYESLHEVTAQYAHTTVRGVGSYRDRVREESAYDMPCDALLFSAKEKEKRDILLTVYACHPTVLNESNLLNSRDLVYGCDKYLQTRRENTDILFLNGACADASTRYTRQKADFEECERLGAIWAEAVLGALENAKPLLGPIRAQMSELFLPPAEFFSETQRGEILSYLEEKISACKDGAQQREYIACRSVLQRKTYGTKRDGYTAQLRVLDVMGVMLCSLPFEYASVDACRLKAELEEKSGKYAVICCYSNGYEGYLPSGRPLDRDSGYEDIASPYHHDAKVLVAEAFERMV